MNLYDTLYDVLMHILLHCKTLFFFKYWGSLDTNKPLPHQVIALIYPIKQCIPSYLVKTCFVQKN